MNDKIYMKDSCTKAKEKPKKVPFQIYFLEKDKKKLERLANEEGLTMTGYIVDIIRRK